MSAYEVTYAGFVAFLRANGFSTTVLPDDSPVLPYAYKVAVDLVNTDLATFPLEYQLAVYCLGTSNVINYAQDQSDAPPPDNKFFEKLREKFHIFDFVAGVVESSSDNGTSQGLAVPDSLRNLTLADLQYLKDPYGRRYLAFAQKYGTVWGLT